MVAVACRSKDKTSAEDELAKEAGSSEGASGEEEQASAAAQADADHPKPTAASTRIFYATKTRNVPPRQVEACMSDVSALSSTATNQDTLLEASSKLKTEMAQAPHEVYHWCFYGLMVRLDNALAKNDVIIETQIDVFFTGMKALWLLGAALDQGSGEETYMTYLRHRYVSISKEKFGRSLETLGRPLNQVQERRPRNVKDKPAAEFAEP